MKKVTKKIVAMFLVLAMCVSACLTNVQMANAAETSTLSMYMSGKHAIYVSGGAVSTLSESDSGVFYRPADVDSGVFFNGERIAPSEPIGCLSASGIAGVGYFHLGNIDDTVQVGDVVDIKGLFLYKDGVTIIDVTPMKFVYTGDTYKWQDVTSNTDVGDVTIGVSGIAGSAKAFYTTFKVSNGNDTMTAVPAGNGNTYLANGADSGVFLNGEKLSDAKFAPVAWSAGGVVDAGYVTLPTEAAENDTVTIKGTFVSTSSTYKYIFHVPTAFTYQWNGTAWVEYVAPPAAEVSTFSVYTTGTHAIYVSGGAVSTLTASDSGVFYTPADVDSGVYLNGKRIAPNGVIGSLSASGIAGVGYFHLGNIDDTVQVGDVVDIKGLFDHKDGATTIDVTPMKFVYTGATYKWQDVTSNTDVGDVTIGVSGITGSAKEFYTTFKVAGGNSTMTAVPAGNGNTYLANGADSGVFLNGEKLSSATFAPVAWSAGGVVDAGYVTLPTEAAENDTVTIKGTFVSTSSTYKYIFHVPTGFTYQWNGTAWVEYVAPPEIETVTFSVYTTGTHAIYVSGGVASAFTASDSAAFYSPADEESGVFLNGERLAPSGPIGNLNGAGIEGVGYFHLGNIDESVQVGDVVDIKGLFDHKDGNKTINISPMKFVYTGDTYKWQDVTSNTDVGDVTIGVSGITGSAKAFYTTFNVANGNSTMTAVEAGTGNYYLANGADSGVFLNGEKLSSAAFAPVAWSAGGVVDAGYVTLPTEAAENDTVTIQGTFVSTSSTYKYIFHVPTAFTYQWNGTAWVEYVAPPEVQDVTLSLFTNYHEDHIIYFTTSIAGLTLVPNDEESGIFLNGTRIAHNGAIGRLTLGWDNVSTFQMAADAASGAKAGDVVTVKGTFQDSNGALYKISEITVMHTGSTEKTDKWIDVTSHTNVGDANLGLSGVLQNADSFYTTFHLTTGSMTGVPAGQIAYAAIGADSGVFLNGTKLSEATFAPVAWNAGDVVDAGYVVLGQNAVEGDKVVVKGTFVSKSDNAAYKNIINVVPFMYQWNGTTWVEYVNTNTDTMGDINDDAAFNSVDLVKAVKVFKAGEGADYLNVIDLDCDGECTAADIAMFRSFLIRGITRIQSFADCPPAPTDSSLRTYFDAGFTTYVLTEDFNDISADGGKETYLNFARKASQYGNVLYRNQTDSNSYWTDKGLTGNYLKDSMVNALGFYQNDEPSLSEIDGMTAIADWQNENAPDKMFHVNLYPSYASSSVIGSNYSTYVQKYVDTVLARVNGPKTLSIDYYALSNESYFGGLYTGANVLRENYLSDLSIIASAAKTYNETTGITSKITTSMAIQAFNHTDDNKQRDIQSLADINFQVNTALAFGAKQLEYFAYESNNVYHGMVNENTATGGEVADGVYDYVKTVNTNVNKWGHIITAFDWQGIYAHEQESNGELSKQEDFTSSLTLAQLNGISAITTTKDTLVSEFKDEEGRYGYMVTNFTDPIDNQSDSVTVTLKDAEEALVYQNGKVATKIASGATITLNAGEGAFIIPCK